MPQNGRLSLLVPNSEGAPDTGSNGTGQFYDMSRRRDRVRQAAAQRGYGDATREARGYGKQDAEAAAKELCNLLKQGRLRVADVEAEQRADADRLVGWAAVGGEPGTIGAEKRAAVDYRMRVRDLALAEFRAYELSDSISYTRRGQSTAPQAPWTPRPGLPPSGGRGGPVV